MRLENFQRDQGLRAANKLTQKHIYFENHKMNVKLAFQTFSESVSNSLNYLQSLDETKGMFAESEATAEFCLIMNNMGDLLNCKSKFLKGPYKSPHEGNFFGKKTLAMDLEKNVSLMTHNKGENILKTNRKTGFLGIIINLRNPFTLFEDLNKKGLEFLLTYKLSQDFLETFFGAIRSRGGFNNNPNCLQFKTAYRQLLLRYEIKELDNGNCSFDGVQILHTSSKSVDNSSEVNTDVEINPEEIDEDIILSTFYELTHYVEGVVDYIAGFVAKKLKTKFEFVFKIWRGVMRRCHF
jgi:hypothetical protein